MKRVLVLKTEANPHALAQRQPMHLSVAEREQWSIDVSPFDGWPRIDWKAEAVERAVEVLSVRPAGSAPVSL